MKTETKATTTASAFGTPIEGEPLPYEYSWKVYETEEEFVAAKAELTIPEQIKVVNTKAESNARTKAMNAALLLAGYEKPTIQNNADLRWKTVYDGIMASKVHSEDKARELATLATGHTPED